MDSKLIEDFCQEYCVGQISVDYKNYGLSQFGIESKHAVICEMKLPHEQLVRLIERQAEAIEMIAQQEKEKDLRLAYDSVRQAYDEYQLLLALTQKEQNEL